MVGQGTSLVLQGGRFFRHESGADRLAVVLQRLPNSLQLDKQ
jgi:hypothetical protein